MSGDRWTLNKNKTYDLFLLVYAVREQVETLKSCFLGLKIGMAFFNTMFFLPQNKLMKEKRCSLFYLGKRSDSL